MTTDEKETARDEDDIPSDDPTNLASGGDESTVRLRRPKRQSKLVLLAAASVGVAAIFVAALLLTMKEEKQEKTEDPLALYQVAKELYEMGEHEAALNTLRRARRMTTYSRALKQLDELELEIKSAPKLKRAERLIKERNYREAREQLNVILREYPEHEKANLMMKLIPADVGGQEEETTTAVAAATPAPAEPEPATAPKVEPPAPAVVSKPAPTARRPPRRTRPRPPRRRTTRPQRTSKPEPREPPIPEPEPPKVAMAEPSKPSSKVPKTVEPAREKIAPPPAAPKVARLPEPEPLPEPKALPKAPIMPAPKPPKAVTGTLRVLSDTPGYVFVNGQNTGKTTPVKLKLPAGTYEIGVLMKTTNVQIKHKVRVKSGKSIKLRLKGD